MDLVLTGMATLVLAGQVILSAAEDPDAGIVTKDNVSPGGIGFLIFVLLGLGTFFLWRSMSKQLKRIDIPESVSGESSSTPGRSPWTRSLPLRDEEPGGGS